MSVRQIFIVSSIAAVIAILLLSLISPYFLLFFIIVAPIIAVGVRDITQKRQTIRRNFPVIGNFRYMLEKVRPEIMQYFVETDTDGKSISRLFRSIFYHRATIETSTSSFGTQLEVYNIE